jgi:hypothetical protein
MRVVRSGGKLKDAGNDNRSLPARESQSIATV